MTLRLLTCSCSSMPLTTQVVESKRINKREVWLILELVEGFWIGLGFVWRVLGLSFHPMENKVHSKFKRVCVFCGSSSGNREIFGYAALDLGRELANRRIDLVYGGGSVGLMGLISQTVYDGGCHVLGIIPTALTPAEISGQTVGEVRTVSDMHERKALMAKESDAFIALPGGYGTMEELLEMITWSQLGIHRKPVGLLNVDGYYNSLLALFDNGVKEGFIRPAARDIVLSAPTATELMAKMENYTALHEGVVPPKSWEI